MCPDPYGSHSPDCSLGPPATLPMPQDAFSAPQGHQPLPLWRQTRGGLQLPTVLPCLAMGPDDAGLALALCPGLASACPCPHCPAQPSLELSLTPVALIRIDPDPHPQGTHLNRYLTQYQSL